MSVNINLVDSKNSDAARREKIKKLRAISFGILFITAFLSVIIFAIDYRFSASYVKKQESDLLRELEPFNEVSAKLFIVNTKLFDIAKLLAKRTNNHEKVTKITEGNKGEVLITQFTTNDTGTEIRFTSDSLSAIDDYLNYLVDLTKTEDYSAVFLESIKADDTGYKVEVKIV